MVSAKLPPGSLTGGVLMSTGFFLCFFFDRYCYGTRLRDGREWGINGINMYENPPPLPSESGGSISDVRAVISSGIVVRPQPAHYKPGTSGDALRRQSNTHYPHRTIVL